MLAFDDNICGPDAHQCLPKFVDNICQSASSQVFASLAHPSAADNHTLSDGAEHPTDRFVADPKYFSSLNKLLSIQTKESLEDFSATYLFVCGKSVYRRCSQKIFPRKSFSELFDVE